MCSYSSCFLSFFKSWATLTHDLGAFNLVIHPVAVFAFNSSRCQLKWTLWEKWVTLFAFGVIAAIMVNYHFAPNTQAFSLSSLQCSPLSVALVLVPCYNQLSSLQAQSSPLQSSAITAGQTNCLFTAAPDVCPRTRRVMVVETLWGV